MCRRTAPKRWESSQFGIEEFVLFTEGVPASVSTGDVIRAKVTSFDRWHAPADTAFNGCV